MKWIMKTYPQRDDWATGILHTVVTGYGKTPTESQADAITKLRLWIEKEKKYNREYREVEV